MSQPYQLLTVDNTVEEIYGQCIDNETNFFNMNQFRNLDHNKIKLLLTQWDTQDDPVGWDLSNENNDNENMMEGIIKTMARQNKKRTKKTKRNTIHDRMYWTPLDDII